MNESAAGVDRRVGSVKTYSERFQYFRDLQEEVYGRDQSLSMQGENDQASLTHERQQIEDSKHGKDLKAAEWVSVEGFQSGDRSQTLMSIFL